MRFMFKKNLRGSYDSSLCVLNEGRSQLRLERGQTLRLPLPKLRGFALPDYSKGVREMGRILLFGGEEAGGGRYPRSACLMVAGSQLTSHLLGDEWGALSLHHEKSYTYQRVTVLRAVSIALRSACSIR